MSRYVPVEGFSDLVRDTESNAIINLNESEIRYARERKRLRQEKKMQEEELKNKIQLLENDMTEIKNSLNLILGKLS